MTAINYIYVKYNDVIKVNKLGNLQYHQDSKIY